MQQDPIPSTSAEPHANLEIKVLVLLEPEKKYEEITMKNGDKIKDLQPKIRSLFGIPSERRVVLYDIFDDGDSKVSFDDEYVLKDKDCLCFYDCASSSSSDTERSHTSEYIDSIPSNRSSNEEEKGLLADDERWLQQYFQKKFGLTKRF